MENSVSKQNKRRDWALIARFTKGSRLSFVIALLCSALVALADMLGPQIIRAAVDNALGGLPADYPKPVMALVEKLGGFKYLGEHIWIMALGLLIVALIRAGSQYAFRLCNTMAAEGFVKSMRDGLFSHIERLPFSWHMKHRTGDIIQRCTSDIDTVKNFISEQMSSIFRIIVLLALSVAFMLSMNPRLTGIVMIPVPIIIVMSFVFHSKIGKAFLDCDENEGILSDMAQENLTGVRVVRAFGKERYERDRFEAQNRHYTGLWMKLARPLSVYWSVGDILSGVMILLSVVFGSIMCIHGTLSSGEFLAFISYTTMMVWPVRMLGRMIAEMSKAGVSLGRVSYIMSCSEERPSEKALTPPLDGDICFENVTFGYDDGAPILRDVSFTIKAGTTLGILGGTGSGKSTIALLLDKLYELSPEQGRITIGGVDIRDISTPYLRRNIGMVLQEPFLFSRSIAENIAIAAPEAGDERIRQAAAAACLEETIEGFSKGYDTFVGERGVTLSGGQKQRVAIARVLVGSKPIMIFDDSLSAVDTETDAKIRAELEKRFGTASIVLISHRISTLSKADMIIVLDKGRIAEAGSHEQLKAAGGIYGQICRLQSGAEEGGI